MTDAERIEELEARVQQIERFIRTIVYVNDLRPSVPLRWTSAPAREADQ